MEKTKYLVLQNGSSYFLNGELLSVYTREELEFKLNKGHFEGLKIIDEIPKNMSEWAKKDNDEVLILKIQRVDPKPVVTRWDVE